MSEVVHIASQAIFVGSRIRQRCVWCGAELIDVDLTRVAVQSEHADKPYPTWPPGGLIGRDGGATYVVDAELLPETSCVAPDDLSTLGPS